MAMNDFQRFLTNKGKLHDNTNFHSRTTEKQLKNANRNRKLIIERQLDGMYDRGKISLEKQPKGFGIDFDRWALNKFGLRQYAGSLENGEFAGKPEAVTGRLTVLGVTAEEIKNLKEAGKKEPSDRQKAANIMRSKVMSLGNRLSNRMDRRAAFIKAWAIVKAGGLELAVKGVSFGNRQEALRRLSQYEPAQVRAFIVPEPENAADRRAAAVMVGVQNDQGLFRLGYVPANLTAFVSVIGGQLPALRLVSGSRGWAGKTTFGARFALAV
jgi:hypothetical protein